MGCPSSVILNDTLVFSVCTHNPETAATADADGLPTYRVYSGVGETLLLSGDMAKADDANTTGYYAASIVCSAANGFVAGVSYSIFVSATVAGTPGSISFGFIAATKAGYALSATGLDAITSAEPTAKPTTFPGWLMWLVQRFRRAKMTTTALTVETEAGAAVTTQTLSDNGTTQQVGPPT
jgi:hypothetical protein